MEIYEHLIGTIVNKDEMIKLLKDKHFLLLNEVDGVGELIGVFNLRAEMIPFTKGRSDFKNMTWYDGLRTTPGIRYYPAVNYDFNYVPEPCVEGKE